MWQVFWKDMVVLFNFRSENALRSAHNVSDHHKGWAILSTCRKALVDELMVPFVRKELNDVSDASTLDLSPNTFFKYLDSGKVQDPNYRFLVDFAFDIIEALFLHRAGVRSGQADLMWSGRAKYSKVWCGRNHPSYRELAIHDHMQRLIVPNKLGQFIDRTMSLNLSGIPYTGEGPDFRLEEVNKGVQSFLPLSPTDEDWATVCTN